MPPLRRIGFFHFGGDEKTDPLGSLEIEIGKWPDAELKGSLIVLPEGFNARKGYYWAPPDLDCRAMARLQTFSARGDIVFVAGLIDGVKGPNSAYLIDGMSAPVLLSRKRCGGRDCLYTPNERDEDIACESRGIGVAALICDDANLWTEDQRRPTVQKIERMKTACNVLCIPACMTITDSSGVAGHWRNQFTAVVLANGCWDYPSVILQGDKEKLSPRHDGDNRIMLCDLSPRGPTP